jgi:D-alanyl-D-alanine carboxypeptidase
MRCFEFVDINLEDVALETKLEKDGRFIKHCALIITLLCSLFLLSVFVASAQVKQGFATPTCSRDGVASIVRGELAEALKGDNVPGVTAAVYIPTRFSQPISVAIGWSEIASKRLMKPDSRILAGSIGKTFYAAAALRLVDMGKLNLDQTIEHYLPAAKLPSADKVTVRMLLSHTSGYGGYDNVFMQELIENPTRVRTLEDWVGPLRRTSPAKPGEFRYSDINFVILAHIIDRAAGTPATEFIRSQFLRPYHLDHTEPSDKREIPGLAQGYAGPTNFFGRDTMIESGKLIYNPQFESGGGGYVSTSGDLTRWITLFGTSTIFTRARWSEASAETHKDPKTGDAYGLGIHIDSTPQGTAYGHSGYIPGYVSWARWYERPSIAVAIQTNTSDRARLTWDGFDISNRIVRKIEMACSH